MHFQQNVVVETINNSAPRALVVLHGYGQLARYFIKKFEHIKTYDIIAVQAPNLFYLNGFSGRVGANWMTKENRLEAIDNQHQMLLALKKFLGKKYESVALCGFSQGVATASRWMMWGDLSFEKVLLYAGEIAREALSYFKNPNVDSIKYAVGDEDEFFSLEKVQLYQNKLTDLGISLKLDLVSGNHSVDNEVVSSFFGEF
jgi:predicted esterase